MSSGEECYDEPIDRVTLSDDAFTDRLSEGIDRFIERSKNWIHVKENDSESIGIFLSVARGEAIWLIGSRNSLVFVRILSEISGIRSPISILHSLFERNMAYTV